MKRYRYTLEEIHRYANDLETVEKMVAMWPPGTRTGAAYRNIAEVMREVLLRMHESLLKHGPYRSGLIGRMFATREIRKEVTEIAKANIRSDTTSMFIDRANASLSDAVQKSKPKESIK